MEELRRQQLLLQQQQQEHQALQLRHHVQHQELLRDLQQKQQQEHQALQLRHHVQHQELLRDLQQKQQQEHETLLRRHCHQQQELRGQSLYHLPSLHQHPQREQLILRGNLPPSAPGSSSCRTVFVGNIHPHVTEPQLEEFFSNAGSVESVKLCQEKYTTYGFVDYVYPQHAAHAIETLNDTFLNGQLIIVKRSAAERENTSTHFHIFVGDLGPEITNAELFTHFSQHPSFLGAKVMQDQCSGKSRSFGFVSFRTEQDAESAIKQFDGSVIGNRKIRCDWERQNRNVAAKNDQRNTTVYISKLPFGATEDEVGQYFRSLGAGTVVSVDILEDKRSGFVKYMTHAEAAAAMAAVHNKMFSGNHEITCAWARSKRAR